MGLNCTYSKGKVCTCMYASFTHRTVAKVIPEIGSGLAVTRGGAGASLDKRLVQPHEQHLNRASCDRTYSGMDGLGKNHQPPWGAT